jgi:hypothetical protein
VIGLNWSYNASVAAAWICDRCGSIGVGEMCMQCGNHLKPARPAIAEPGSYFWILGYRTPGIFRFMGWYAVAYLPLVAAGAYLLPTPMRFYAIAVAVAPYSFRMHLLPIAVVSLAILWRCYAYILIALAVGLIVHSLVEPDTWRFLIGLASSIVLALAIIVGIGFVIAPWVRELGRVIARQLRKLRG